MRKIFALLVAVPLVACGSKDLSEPQEEERFAIIYGRVIDTEGAPVANADVNATAYETCASTASVGSESAITSAQGNYRIRIEYPDGERHCVILRATPGGTAVSNLIGDTIQIPDVQFREVPTDSIQRTIIFTVRGTGGGGNPGS